MATQTAALTPPAGGIQNVIRKERKSSKEKDKDKDKEKKKSTGLRGIRGFSR